MFKSKRIMVVKDLMINSNVEAVASFFQLVKVSGLANISN